MKLKIVLISILLFAFILLSVTSYEPFAQTPDNKYQNAHVVEYTCPKHPEVVKKEAGTCPICGTVLVEKKKTVNAKNAKKYSNPKVMTQDSTKTKKI